MSLPVNGVANNFTFGATSLSTTITVASGHTIAVIVYHSGTGTLTVSDTGGNTYTAANTISDPFGDEMRGYYSIGLGSGVTSVTVSCTASDFMTMWVWDITGSGPISYSDSLGAYYPFNSPTSTDGVTTGLLSIGTSTDGLLLGVAQDPGGGTLTAGTGFTSDGAPLGTQASEHKAVSANAASTFTDNTLNSRPLCLGLLFKVAAASGAMVGSSALTFGEAGALTGAGTLAGTSALVFGETGGLKGAGVLAGTSALTFAASGTAALAGAMSGTSAWTIGTSGLLAGAGSVVATSALTFGASAVLQGAGALGASSALAFAASGTLSTGGGGTAALTIGATGTLSASGTLAGISALLMSASGTLIDASAVVISTGGGGGGGRLRKKKLGPVMRDNQVFGEAYPIATRQSPGELKTASTPRQDHRPDAHDLAISLRALMQELL